MPESTVPAKTLPQFKPATAEHKEIVENTYFGSLTSRKITKARYCQLENGIVRLASNEKEYGFIPAIIGTAEKQLTIMLNKYGKIFAIRFDFKVSEYTSNNEPISKFLSAFSKQLKRKHSVNDLGYTWARELERAKKQHYHFLFFVDSKAITSNEFTKLATATAKAATGACSHIPEKPFTLVEINDSNAKLEVLERAMYLAKSRGKFYKNRQAKNYGSSRIK